MSLFIFANNASTTLATALTTTATTVQVATGSGAEFPNPSAGQQFAVTLTDAATGLINEVMYCTARSGDSMTVIRAQESTTAKTWNVGDGVANFWTAGQAAALVQAPYVQQQPGNYGATDTGTANATAFNLTPSITAYSQIIGAPIRFAKGVTNTGGLTININGIAPINVVHPGGAALSAGEMVGASIYEVVFDGFQFEFISQSAAAGASGPAGGDLTGTYPNPIIAANVVSNGKLAQMPANTVKANLTGSTSNPQDVTLAALALLSPGMMTMHAASLAPSGWLTCDGSAVSRTTYAALFAAIGTTWGAGNGTTTFNVPDMRGQFPRGWDNGAGVDPGRAFGSNQAHAVEYHNHANGVGVTQGSGPPFVYGTITADTPGQAAQTAHTDANTATEQGFTSDRTKAGGGQSPGTPAGTFAAETRPVNQAMIFIIKT